MISCQPASGDFSQGIVSVVYLESSHVETEVANSAL